MSVFHQDNAPAHRARDTAELLHCETPQFISPDMWSANSRDLNPVDYCIWGMMQERVYQVPIRAIRTSCSSGLLRHGLNVSMYVGRCDQSVAMETCIHAHGRPSHFEHLPWRCLPDLQVATKHNPRFAQPAVPHNTRRFSETPSDEWVPHFTSRAVTFFRCDGQVHNHSYSSLYSEIA